MKPIYHYATGEPLVLGDHVLHIGSRGRVVFIADEDEFLAPYNTNTEYWVSQGGFGVEWENGELFLLRDPIEQEMVLLSRDPDRDG